MKSETSVRHKLRLTVDLDVEPLRPNAPLEDVRHAVSASLRWALHCEHACFRVTGLHNMRVEPVTDDPPAMSPLGAALFAGAADAARAQAADAALQRDLDAPWGYVLCPNCHGTMPASALVCLTCLHRR